MGLWRSSISSSKRDQPPPYVDSSHDKDSLRHNPMVHLDSSSGSAPLTLSELKAELDRRFYSTGAAAPANQDKIDETSSTISPKFRPWMEYFMAFRHRLQDLELELEVEKKARQSEKEEYDRRRKLHAIRFMKFGEETEELTHEIERLQQKLYGSVAKGTETIAKVGLGEGRK